MSELSAPRPPLRRAANWLRGVAASLIIAAAVIGVHAGGGLDGLEHRLMDLRFQLTPMAPSGSTVIVGIDAKSLSQLDHWPWPRHYYAEVINRLVAAGAKRIAIDVDFSSRSNAKDDAALVAAVRHAGGRVTLPIFKQWIGPRRKTLVSTRPFDELRKVADLAAVNIRPSSDSLVRSYDRYERWSDVLVPTLGEALSSPGFATSGARGPFYLDYGIRVEDVPHLDFADVLNGKFNPKTVAGKTVLIGATAVELGDQLAVPVYGALSGVEVQALARESLVLGRALQPIWGVVPYILALLAAFALPWFRRGSWWGGLAACGGASVGLFGLSFGVQAAAPFSLDITPPVFALWLAYGWGLLGRLEVLAGELFKRTMEARDRTAMLTAVLRENAEGVLILDESLNVRMINPAAQRLLQVSERQARGRPAAEIVPVPDLADRFERETADDVGSSRFEIELPRAEEPLTVEVTVGSGAFSPGPSRFERRTEVRHVYFLILRDISEHRRAQEALILAAEKASEADRAKSEFIANVSHELRTPLNAIIGFSEILRKQMFGALGAPQYVEYAEDINLSGQHLLDLINDVLLVSKIESGAHDIRERKLDVAAVAEACMRIVRGYPKAASLNFVTDIPEKLPSLNADERAFRQILLNILSNAVKFTPAGGRVHFGVRVESLGDLAITITDTGIGIAAANIPQVTDPFFQVEGAMQRQFSGTGLGLNIVAKLAALHGATLDIESREGVGTAVTIRFPPGRVISSENVVRLDVGKDRRQKR